VDADRPEHQVNSMSSDDAQKPAQSDRDANASNEPFALTSEQRDTGALLERLLGTAVAERYIDFLKLAAGSTNLRVTIPLAGHALREIEGTIRNTLAASMDVEVEQDDIDIYSEPETKIVETLSSLGYSKEASESAIKSLRPKIRHAEQIEKIVVHLGLAPDGDIANAWVTLSRTAEQAHKRDFHRSLRVDDEFRKKFQEPFEVVVRGLMIALEPRFSAMTQRAEALAAMIPISRAVKLFAKEIPGSLPLQWHFYQVLTTPGWLPFLIERNLTSAPVHEPALGMTFRQWPVGIYLLRMAKLHDGTTPVLVAGALRTVADSKHRDVRQQGFDIAAALPSAEAASVADIIVAWLTPDIRNGFLDAPQKTVKTLVEGGEITAALAIAKAVFQLIDENGSIATLHSHHMYEHYLPETVKVLATADPVEGMNLFADLLTQGIAIKGNYVPADNEDYTHHTPHSIANNEMWTYEPYDALILAIRDCALSAVNTAPGDTAAIVSSLYLRGPRIFKRLALHVLSRQAAVAPALSASYLMDTSLIGESWCDDEYAELALAWFPSLAPVDRQAILRHIDTIPDQYRNMWAGRFEEQQKRPPDANDINNYNNAVFRDAVWKWREALPANRKAQIEAIVTEQGNPDAWHERLFPTEVSPLTGTDFASRSIPEIVNFLQTWQPQPGPQKQTVTALAQQLREAVDQEPLRFAEQAERFAGLRPIYVRRLLEGLESAARNKPEIPWASMLALMESVVQRANVEDSQNEMVKGDDPDWLWACTTAASVLRFALGQGLAGIPYEFTVRIVALIKALLRVAPSAPETNDFDNQFEKHTYFSAEQTLRGRSIELCILHVFWESKHPGSPSYENPRAAFAIRGDIRTILQDQLADQSANGRIPRAIIGRWMQWLVFFGKEWLTEHVSIIFPSDNDGLRLAAWRAHLLSDGGPVKQLMPRLLPIYMEEIAHMAGGRKEAGQQQVRDDEQRDKRLGEYILILYLGGDAPAELMQGFWNNAPGQARQHLIWFLGSYLQLPADKLPAEMRARGYAYWDARLSAGIAATDKEPFRKELGAIATWCRHDAIPTDWLLGQLLAMLTAGFAPNSGYSVVEWLAKNAETFPSQAVNVLELLLRNPHTDHWTYTTHRNAIRTILASALASGNEQCAAQAEATIGYLASIGEGEHLNLTRPASITVEANVDP
jgi:hypothetical protein